MRDLVREIETVTGKSAVLAAQPGDGTDSPFGAEHDWFMSITRLRDAGFAPPSEIRAWLRELVAAYAAPCI